MSKLTVQMSPEMDQVLEGLAAKRGMKKAQVMRRAVLLMKYLDEEASEGKNILVEDPKTGASARLVMESAIEI